MSKVRQKIIFKGPLSDSLYAALTEYISKTEVSQESVIDDTGISLVQNDEGSKKFIVSSRSFNTIIVYGISVKDVDAVKVAEFANIYNQTKNKTQVQLLLLDNKEVVNVFTECMIIIAKEYESPTYTSFDRLVKDLMEAN
ncbi:MAG: hypothetical protein M0R77_00785 [Gammaproteobacteria bacterium]|nr:hypothetical protein [Acholeplasmataceae bacterium]MCK9529090.1 hypothetical protein [Gammaproteobacteria bacterium]